MKAKESRTKSDPQLHRKPEILCQLARQESTEKRVREEGWEGEREEGKEKKTTLFKHSMKLDTSGWHTVT